MGETISTLVFRPPKPTPIHPSEYFYLDVDVHSPLCTNKRHRGADNGNGVNCDDNGNCGGAMCLDTGESDLASLDKSHLLNLNTPGANNNNDATTTAGSCTTGGYGQQQQQQQQQSDDPERPSGTVPNMKNGQIYKIPAFFIRRRNAKQTLLFSHGNAEDLGMMYNRMKDLAMVLGVNILAYDYTGYGLSIPGPAHGGGGGSTESSSGSASTSHEGPSENMIYRNIEAAFHYLTKVRKIPPHQIILYGRSLGSGPSCYLAAKTALNGESVGGLILHSPFLSVYKVVADLNGLDMGIVGDMFHNEKRGKNVRCPTLIIHGRQDEVVPFWHAQRLLAAVPPEFRAQPYYVENMGHNHIESRCRDQYVKVVLGFLRMGSKNDTNNLQQQQQQQGYTHRTNGGYSPQQSFRGPSPVPEHERASESEISKDNASFYVNKTWLRHAKVLLNEVFADVGCNVNTTTNQDWEHRSNVRGSNAGASSRRENGTNNNRPLSDARDDQDEFAPWKGGNRVKSPGATSGYRNASPIQQQRQQHPQSQRILTTRPNMVNQNNRSRGPITPKYYSKAKSMPDMDRVGQFGDALHAGSPPNKAAVNVPYNKSQSMQLSDMSRQRRY